MESRGIKCIRNLFLLIAIAGIPVVGMINSFVLKNVKIDAKNETAVIKVQNLFFTILIIIIAGVCVYNFISKSKDEFVSEKLYPVKATEWIKENLDVENMRLFNHYNFGSYLLLNDIPVFIDSRCDLYTSEFNKNVNVFNDYINTENGEMTYKNLFKKYDINYALVYKDSKDDIYLDECENAQNIYEDDYFVIYEYLK